jgi:galactose-1-phosphate uridylyltransferase
MKKGIRFEKHVQKSTFHNPMLGNELDTQEITIRRDPLTGHQSVFNPSLEDKVAVFFGPSDQALIDRLARESESRCFLCGDNWKLATPTYPKELVPEGRIQVGEAVLFPNLFPVAHVHAVIRVGAKHYIRLGGFEPGLILEAFQVSSEFAKALSQGEPDVRYVTINGNYLHPAGASIPHPHFQIAGADLPFTYMEGLFDHSRRYHQEQGSCYWSDIVQVEKELGERYIGETGPASWIASFSPQGTNEILGILPERMDFLEMDDEDLKGLAEGLSCVLKGYDSMGVSTFNFAVYSGPLGGEDDAFRCYIRIISRQNVYENYRTDDYFLQKLLRNELILTPPEILATTMREVMERD